MKVTNVVLHGIAGYETLRWANIRPDLNILVGRNGCGKSTLLHAITFALKQICGQRGEDLLTRRFGEGVIDIRLSGLDEWCVFKIADVLRRQGMRRTEYAFNILGFEENRQPQNTVGRELTSLTQRPNVRYRGAGAQMRSLLLSGDRTDLALADEVFAACTEWFPPPLVSDWQDTRGRLTESRQKELRPVSCGEFDILAVALDLVRLKHVPGASDNPSFVLVDNPDTYLHPACLDPLFDMFRSFLPDAQLFVASHSLRLLFHSQPSSVFWLNRDQADGSGVTTVHSIRELDDGGKRAFFDIYGDDVSSGVLSLLGSLESPEYYAFLRSCALPAEVVARPNPANDRQMTEIAPHTEPAAEDWTIFDYGAGNGDLLVALSGRNRAERCPTYVAWTREDSPRLNERIQSARAEGLISPRSMVLTDPWKAPPQCDTIVMCNVCHEIPMPDLADILARLLTSHLASKPTSRLIIHEVETLPTGEQGFIMWEGTDFERIFGKIPGLSVRTEKNTLSGGVPLETTIINVESVSCLPPNLAARLVEGFRDALQPKVVRALDEIGRQPSSTATPSPGLARALRQRRHAFLTAQVTNILQTARRLRWSLTLADARPGTKPPANDADAGIGTG